MGYGPPDTRNSTAPTPVMLNRRSFILSGVVALALPMAMTMPAFGSTVPSRSGSRLDSLVPQIDPVLDLRNSNTDERIKVRFFRETGYDLEAVRQFNWFMRDWRQSKAEQMDVRLLWGLAAIRMSGLKAGNEGRINVNSGYRTNATNKLLRRKGYGAARNSLHLKAKAIDFTMPGAKVATRPTPIKPTPAPVTPVDSAAPAAAQATFVQ